MRELRWVSEEGDGFEHLAFDARATASRWKACWSDSATARIMGCTTRCVAMRNGVRRMPWLQDRRRRRAHELHGDGEGHWRDGRGLELSAIEGCIDIDIAATPYTNTLPIRRLQLAEGERQPISVAYISTPDFQVTRAEQAYSCIAVESRVSL